MNLALNVGFLWTPHTFIAFRLKDYNIDTLAILFNSTIIEIYDDIIQLPHGFEDCQMSRFIAAIGTLP
jgi:hypothetical protein